MDNERRTADRRISPAIGEFAIAENARLRASNAVLLAALQNVLQYCAAPTYCATEYWEAYERARAAIVKAQP